MTIAPRDAMISVVELPEHCFCGCGAPRSRRDTANLEGFNVSIALVYWLQNMTVRRINGNVSPAETDEFMEAGRDVYLSLLAQAHNADQPSKDEIKMTHRWIKFSAKARKKIRKQSGLIEALDFPTIGPIEVREWATNDEFPAAFQAMVDEVERLREQPD